ncbi:hypothetical protein D5F01_LYC00199 [Larimichthys crocea]|uniref:PiggyBac transposable element-derived protein domain-containing protein n=1 Tax=Larimichthys crocea TaxID=215358 RepID=A0A6G0J8G5_LARCR|nr:hypothetical protein D5F01_LYC00199 [Larimichthys crocea]
MARRYSVKAPTGRWPVAVFYNILDLAAVNAHILFKKCTYEQVSRRNFIMRLAIELRSDHMSTKTMLVRGPGPGPEQQQMEKRKQCQVRRNCRKNKTKDCEDGPLSSLMDCEDPANEDSEVESDQLQSNSESSEDSSEDEGGEEMWVAEWTSKNEIVWSPTHVETCRSVPAASTLIPGPTHYATTQISDPFSSFALLLTDQILEHIKAMTNLHGRRSIANWRDVDMEELQAFVGLLILGWCLQVKE